MLDRHLAVGELEICVLCNSSSHAVGCPRHQHYNDERFSYRRSDAADETGPASYWVEGTYALAAIDDGEPPDKALREGIEEFQRALESGDLTSIRN
jgi:hypothetical protein